MIPMDRRMNDAVLQGEPAFVVVCLIGTRFVSLLVVQCYCIIFMTNVAIVLLSVPIGN
jgi:hypothetical protein